MKKILILMGRYLPGYKDGGPLRTIANVVEALGDEYKFYIGCLDRDHGDGEAYPGIRKGEWNQVGKAKVWYVEPGGFSDDLILELAKGKSTVYLTSFYDDYGYKTLWLNRRGKIAAAVYLAAMGVFSEGALAQKALKKKIFIKSCKHFHLFDNITWSVTSELEAGDLRRVVGAGVKYVIAEDLPRDRVPGDSRSRYSNRIVFLSRISPKKNLLGAIEALNSVNHEFVFDIYGPQEDNEYWRKCESQLAKVEFSWSYKGDVPMEKVQDVFSQHDIFIFPTLGENYGHVIFEALSVGCVPVISNQTPWNVINEKHGGIVLPLANMAEFGKAIDAILSYPQDERRRMALAGVGIAKECVRRNKENTGYRSVFG